MSYQKFARDVGFIGTVQILTSLSTFFLLPIITKTLGAYDYGLWAQINITVSLISSLALMGLSMSFVRFLSSETDKKIIREAVYSILFFVTISGFLASFCYTYLQNYLRLSVLMILSNLFCSGRFPFNSSERY